MKLQAIVYKGKEFVKLKYPRLWDLAVRLMFSEHVWALRTWHTRRAEARQLAANLPYLAVNMSSRMGMGAQMTWMTVVLAYCDDEGLLPRLLLTNPLYASASGEDWLGTFFEPQGPLLEAATTAPPTADRYVLESVHTKRRMKATLRRLSLTRVRDTFFSALRFRPELVAQAETFCRASGIDSQTIGVHFRGTDKRQEATRVNWDQLAVAVAAALPQGYGNIFVATDEPAFLAFMRERFGSELVLDLECKEIFTGGPAHMTAGDPYVKGSEALQTMLVLARCGLLIRTRSHLSAWAKIMNPSLPTVIFGEMHGGALHVFPENLIETDYKPATHHTTPGAAN